MDAECYRKIVPETTDLVEGQKVDVLTMFGHFSMPVYGLKENTAWAGSNTFATWLEKENGVWYHSRTTINPSAVIKVQLV